jgi:hypothetical protein
MISSKIKINSTKEENQIPLLVFWSAHMDPNRNAIMDAPLCFLGVTFVSLYQLRCPYIYHC